MANIIMVVGGSRSGKSYFAEQTAGELAIQSGRKVFYLATATIWDSEFAERVEKHRQSRPADWSTVEEPCDIDRALLEKSDKTGIVLVDGIGTWVTNLMYRDNWPEFKWNSIREEAFYHKVGSFIEACRLYQGSIILVADEAGMGIVPDNEQGRIFRDLNGWANQHLAQEAGEVYLMTCGIPLQVK